MRLKHLFLLMPCALGGCATGFDRDAMTARMSKESITVTDEEITKIRALRPQLSFPCKIAVHMSDEGDSWRWSQQDKQSLETWAKTLVDAGIASDVFFISDMFADKSSNLLSLRVAAAKYGADALLTIKGTTQVDEYINPAAAFNLTVVGGYIIPGSHRDALFMTRGALVDVGNGYLYATAESEGEGKIIRPTFIIDKKDAIAKAKEVALQNFGEEMTKRIRRLYETHKDLPILPPAPASPVVPVTGLPAAPVVSAPVIPLVPASVVPPSSGLSD
ncbi:hypothetical protein [Zavarzinella formosa]|uniref:hypothetical protein n=1 Tax=Zavarzinella formosa TaxID=360055 RepID=UPI0002E1C0B7|nr:hypothetical protein [Zavarzinella formosa]